MPNALIFTGLLASYIATETFSLGVEHLIIKDAELPPAFHNLKVCFASDIHHGRYSRVKRLQEMVRKINQTQPDVIIFGGDYLQTHHHQKIHLARLRRDFTEFLQILSRLHPPRYGSYAVLGNHDYAFKPDFYQRQFAQVGITLLHNRGVFLRSGSTRIRLSGVEDLWFGRPDLHRARGTSTPTDFHLLVTHQPNFIDTITAADGINFVFAGHTHGGQLSAFNYLPYLPRQIARWEYTVGLIETPQTRMLVSPGVGNVLPYIRFFSPPKIHLLTFKSAPRVKTK
jgi:predicted MPP superfamily phosphohydrolase